MYIKNKEKMNDICSTIFEVYKKSFSIVVRK